MDGIPIGRIAGFPVSVNWNVLVILWLFTRSLASTLPAAVPGYSNYRTPKCLGGSTDSADLSWWAAQFAFSALTVAPRAITAI